MNAGRFSFVLRPGREKVLALWEQGRAPSDFLYGFCELKEQVATLRLEGLDLLRQPKRKWGLQWGILDRVLSSLFLCKVGLGAALEAGEWLEKRSWVVTNIDSIGMSLALLRALVPMRFLHLHVSQGLTNLLESPQTKRGWWTELQLACTAAALRGIDQVLVLGVGAEASLQRYHLRGRGKNGVLQFGVDTRFWCPKAVPDDGTAASWEPFLLSVGSDAGRDYDTLSLASLPLPLKVVTRLALPQGTTWESLPGISDLELRELYREAQLVILPLKDLSQPSGQSAALQAMACGAPVLITRTRGFWDPDGLVEGRDLVFLKKPGDALEITQVVRTLLANSYALRSLAQRGCDRVRSWYSISRYASDLGSWIAAVQRSARDLVV